MVDFTVWLCVDGVIVEMIGVLEPREDLLIEIIMLHFITWKEEPALTKNKLLNLLLHISINLKGLECNLILNL